MEESRGGVYFVYDETTAERLESFRPDLEEAGFEILDAAQALRRSFRKGDRVLIHTSLASLKGLLPKGEQEGVAISVLASSSQSLLHRALGFPRELAEAIEVLRHGEPQPVDILYGGEEPVLFNALVGDAPPLSYRNKLLGEENERRRIGYLLRSLAKLRRLRLAKVKITTAKEQRIETGAIGIVLFNRGSGNCAANLIDDPSYNDGQLRAVLIAPRSFVGYLGYLLAALFPAFRGKGLPQGVGLVKSEALQIESEPGMEVTIDGEKKGRTPVRFAVHPKALRICAPERFWEKSRPTRSEKETLRIQHLPQPEELELYRRRSLPFFSHASEQEYKELFASLREEGRLSWTFVVLMIFSSLLATVGLFLNSGSVVIGAMLLAPLMQPIVGFAMAVLRWHPESALVALRTVLAGVVLTLLSAMAIAWTLPFRELTTEMAGRLHPTLMDLIVAVVSGMAAAYAKSDSRISGSLVGVAIAVALVPPLATAGIGLGWGEWGMFWHAFLLFLTNFVGIVLAAGMVFVIRGYSPIRRAQKGLSVALVTVLLVAWPLSASFEQMASDAKIRHRLVNKELNIGGKRVRIERVILSHAHEEVLSLELLVSAPLDMRELSQLKERFRKLYPERFTMKVTQRIRL